MSRACIAAKINTVHAGMKEIRVSMALMTLHTGCLYKEIYIYHIIKQQKPDNHFFFSSTKEDLTMVPEEYIGNCARSMNWKAQTGGMSIHLLMS